MKTTVLVKEPTFFQINSLSLCPTVYSKALHTLKNIMKNFRAYNFTFKCLFPQQVIHFFWNISLKNIERYLC